MPTSRVVNCCLGLLLVLIAMALEGCSKGGTSGPSLSIPPIKPPVVQATPAGLARAARRLREVLAQVRQLQPSLMTPAYGLQVVKDRLFSGGPTDFTFRLGMVDSRTTEYNNRQKEGSGRSCVGQQLQTWSPVLPTGAASFPMQFSCVEQMDQGTSGLSVYFGQAADAAYIAEIQNPPAGSSNPRMAVLARVAMNGTQVQVWQVVADTTNTSSWMQIKANQDTKDLELSVAATSPGTGLGCGIVFRSVNGLIWAKGEFNDQGSAGLNCGSFNTTVCANGTDLTQLGSGNCSSMANSSLTQMTYATLLAGNSGPAAYTMITNPGIQSVTNFNVMSSR